MIRIIRHAILRSILQTDGVVSQGSPVARAARVPPLFAEGSWEGWGEETDCCAAPQSTCEYELTCQLCGTVIGVLLHNICLQVARLYSAVADRQSDSVQVEGAVPSPQQLKPTAEEIENAGTSALYCRPDRENV